LLPQFLRQLYNSVYARGTVQVLPKLLPQFLRQLYNGVYLSGRLFYTASKFERLLWLISKLELMLLAHHQKSRGINRRMKRSGLDGHSACSALGFEPHACLIAIRELNAGRHEA